MHKNHKILNYSLLVNLSSVIWIISIKEIFYKEFKGSKNPYTYLYNKNITKNVIGFKG